MRMKTVVWSLVAAITVGCAWGASPVSAQDTAADGYVHGGPSGVRFDAHLDFGYFANAGIGFRADIPIVADGLLDRVRDDLALSLGAELMWWYRHEYNGFGVIPLAALQWNFYLSDRWDVFPELGITFIFGPHDWNDKYFPGYALPFVGVGARYHFSPRNALLMRVNFPAGFQVGITF